MQRGWVKPEKSLTLEELRPLIAEKRAELAALEALAASLVEDARLEAVVKIRNIMRAQQLSVDDLVGASRARAGGRSKAVAVD